MYKIILAARYLAKRRITYLAVAAVALCVFMVVVVMAVMTGLVQGFKVKNHHWVGDCVISAESLVGFAYYEDFVKILEQADFVEAVSPVIRSYGLLTYGASDASTSVEIMGIEPVRHCRATGFGETLHYHKDDVSKAFEPAYDPNLSGCILGIDQALSRDQYGRYQHKSTVPVFAFSVSCFPLTARGALAEAEFGLVKTKTFYYSDDSHSGLAKVDGSFVYLPFDDAQMLCGMGMEPKRISGLHIKLRSGVRLEKGCDRVRGLWNEFVEKKAEAPQANLLEKVRVESWKGHRREMIAAVEKEQTMMMAAFVMIGMITVFIVLVVFYMIVSHKSKDIGILKSIGVGQLDIVKLFLYFSFLVGVVGSSIGTAAGILFLVKINQIEKWLYDHYGFQLWNRTIYAIDDIPNEVEFETVAIIIVSAILACVVGALLPSWQAAKKEPVETLQVSQL
jgi:lipoprotein-releasing system permease protein